MKLLKKTSKIAEIIGSLGIVVSLIFVAIQYEKNSVALKTSTANSVNSNIANWYSSIADNSNTSKTLIRFLENPEGVSTSERFQAIMKLHSLNLHLQNAFYLEKNEVLDSSLRKSITMAIYSGLNQPGFYFFWNIRKGTYTDEYRDFVEGIIASERNQTLEKLFEKKVSSKDS